MSQHKISNHGSTNNSTENNDKSRVNDAYRACPVDSLITVSLNQRTQEKDMQPEPFIAAKPYLGKYGSCHQP